MRVLFIYCHPLGDSFHAAILAAAIKGLKAAGHTVDLMDLYAESFEPTLTADERRHYFESPRNQAGLETYVARLRSAEALVLQFPTWCFGPPAMLKGFFDRLLIPGVAYDPATSKPSLLNIRKIVGIVTYGQPWTAAMWMGEAPRKTVTRFLRWFTGGNAKTEYLALYKVDEASDGARRAFIARAEAAMSRI